MAERSVDIIVVGCGIGGAAVALEAKRHGAEVVIVEKQTPDRHTPNTRLSGGYVMAFTNADSGEKYLRGCSGGLVDDSLLRPMAAGSIDTDIVQWFEKIGVTLTLEDPETWGLSRPHGDQPASWAENPAVAGAEDVRAFSATTTLPAPFKGSGHQYEATGTVDRGEAVYRGYMHALAEAGIEILWGTEPTRLIEDAGRVTGARVRGPEGEYDLFGRQGVVLAAGGFGANPDMIRQYMSVPNTKFYGNPGNDGSGIKLAMSVGSDLVRMNRMVGRAVASFELDDGFDMGFMVILHGGGYVLCDQAGERFADEYSLAQQNHSFYYLLQQLDAEAVSYSRSPSYYIFDERRRAAGPMTYHDRGGAALGIYDWSSDNSKEIASGWIAQGATPGEAARAAGASPEAAVAVDEQVRVYNAAIEAGDPDPQERPDKSRTPLDQPPYYCIPMYCGGPYTVGGPRRDEVGRVLDVFGEPVTGLYSVGEAGQAVGLLYPTSGASITEAVCFGTATGAHLAERA